jgi:hypothetical protein
MSRREFRTTPDSEHDAHAPVLAPQRARQAAPLGHVRYVLAFSLGAAVIAGAIIWIAFFA